ncbi:hypothetical protein [Belnapia rosea]|jgi:hypothetical protein|uniref:PXPV repeat-containing protein n=1 Tax=Belnapia rosea TaxID=938405 RepID=A0A1G6UCM7_9PROT|nr:hypothetical protein [Belnapia rosea]SDB06949.1 hypothetical protein SAMN02927895_00067 [Belnapia rosea]SDD39138.1 hypothetical protein SAMN04487779_1007126 [Belnapia rosea]
MRRLILATLLGLGLLSGAASAAPARPAGTALAMTEASPLVPVQYRRHYAPPPPRPYYRRHYAPPPRRYYRPRYAPPRARYAPPPRPYYRY